MTLFKIEFSKEKAATFTNTYANSVDPDEKARNEPSHKDLQCLPFCSRFLTDMPIRKNDCVQIQKWKSPLRNIRSERFNKDANDKSG